MNHFIYRPIPRLLRYELLLKGILDTSPLGHEDRSAIPQVIETLKLLGKDTEPGVASAEQKVCLWKYNDLILFKPGEHFVRCPTFTINSRKLIAPCPRIWISSMIRVRLSILGNYTVSLMEVLLSVGVIGQNYLSSYLTTIVCFNPHFLNCY
jgi:hypothetical protein